jgi:hypothetical protein
MSMAVRMGDQSLREKLDKVIEKHGTELTSILGRSGVKLFSLEER